MAAADAVGGVVVSPRFTHGDAGTDWNDHATQHGRSVSRAAIQSELRQHGIIIEMPSDRQGATITTQADRDAARQRVQPAPSSSASQAAAREAARSRPTLKP
jgi:phage/plasmid primase-like uncharacterized protein